MKELRLYYWFELGVLLLLAVLVIAIGPKTHLSVYTDVKTYGEDDTITVETARRVHLPEKVLVILALTARAAESAALLAGQQVFIPGAFSLIKVATGYGWVFYVAGLRNGFTLLLAMLYATLLDLGFQFYAYVHKYTNRPNLMGLYSFYRILIMLQIIIVMAVIVVLIDDTVAVGGDGRTYAIAVLLQGVTLELVQRGLQERYFQEILSDVFVELESTIPPNSMARYTSVYQAVYDTAPGLVVQWEFFVRLAEFSKYFIGSVIFMVLADSASPTYIR